MYCLIFGFSLLDQLISMFNDYFLVLGEYVALKGRLVPMDTPGPNTYIYQVTGTLPITVEV